MAPIQATTDDSESADSNSESGEFFATLLHSATSAHVLHLSTRSLAEHLALDDLYKALPEAVDALVEGWQGRNGLVIWPDGWKAPRGTATEFVTSLRDYVDDKRATAIGPDSELQQLVDDVLELLNKTVYKLWFLT